MNPLKIGILEDDLLIAESIMEALRHAGYNPINPVRNYDDAIKMIEAESPDLLVLDITIDGRLDGIDLAMAVNKEYGIPFIFLTAYSDQATVNRAKEANPYAYLVKPFTERDLYSSIEIAFNNFNNVNITRAKKHIAALQNVIFIKEKDLFHKVDKDDIYYLESDNVYLNIYTSTRHFVVRAKLDEFIENFLLGNFVRVHRSYAVNLKHLETINSLTVKVAGKEVPLNKNYRDELLRMVRSAK